MFLKYLLYFIYFLKQITASLHKICPVIRTRTIVRLQFTSVSFYSKVWVEREKNTSRITDHVFDFDN